MNLICPFCQKPINLLPDWNYEPGISLYECLYIDNSKDWNYSHYWVMLNEKNEVHKFLLFFKNKLVRCQNYKEIEVEFFDPKTGVYDFTSRYFIPFKDLTKCSLEEINSFIETAVIFQ